MTTNYDTYIESEGWKAKRAEALERAGHKCQLCGSEKRKLDVHHNTYERLGDELPTDLVVLCASCHLTFHAVSNPGGGEGIPRLASLNDAINRVLDHIEASDGKLIAGVETGFYELDEMLNGLQSGELTIVAARPGMGKSAFLLNIASFTAVHAKAPGVLFSLEMSTEQIGQRLLCSRAGVDSHKLRRNLLNRDDFERMTTAVGELRDASLFLDDSATMTLRTITAKVRRLVREMGVKVVFIDYLQLLSHFRGENRQVEVADISRGLKAMARDHNIAVVCACQLNRGAEQRESNRPRMSDLRESGAIEQDADTVILLHREDYYHRGEEDYEDNNIAEVIVAKQRNGPTGTLKLAWDGGTTSFSNLSRGY